MRGSEDDPAVHREECSGESKKRKSQAACGGTQHTIFIGITFLKYHIKVVRSRTYRTGSIGLSFLIDLVLNIVANVWEWTYVKAQTTLFPQSILHASCLISKAIDITWLILNLHKLYYTKKTKTTIDFPFTACRLQQSKWFWKANGKNKILKNISGSIPAQLRVG
jgi:hypothetical protein